MLLPSLATIALAHIATFPSEPPKETEATISEAGESWSQWRGPSRDGTISGAWPAVLSDETLVERWRIPLGDGYGGPVVGGELVFSFESDEDNETIRALHRTDGREVWSATWAASMQVADFAKSHGNWVRSTPIWDGDALFACGMPDVVVCLQADDGAISWQADLAARHGTEKTAYGVASSPLIHGDGLILQAAHSLICLDRATGATVWRVLEDDHENNPCASPIYTEIDGVEHVVVLTRGELCAVSPVDGDVLWRHPVSSFLDTTMLTPVDCGGRFLTGPFSEALRMIDVSRGEEGALEASVSWTSRSRGNMATPVVRKGFAYTFNASNRFSCIDLEDGSPAWTSPPTGADHASLIAIDDRILALTNAGRLQLFRATDDAFELEADLLVAESPWAHLAISGEELYIRDKADLIAYSWSDRE